MGGSLPDDREAPGSGEDLVRWSIVMAGFGDGVVLRGRVRRPDGGGGRTRLTLAPYQAACARPVTAFCLRA